MQTKFSTFSENYSLPPVKTGNPTREILPDMTEKLLTGTLSLNTNKQTYTGKKSNSGI